MGGRSGISKPWKVQQFNILPYETGRAIYSLIMRYVGRR